MGGRKQRVRDRREGVRVCAHARACVHACVRMHACVRLFNLSALVVCSVRDLFFSLPGAWKLLLSYKYTAGTVLQCMQDKYCS